MTDFAALAGLGWQPLFQQQLSLREWENAVPARVFEQHRSELRVMTEHGRVTVALQRDMPAMVVGDWVLLEKDGSFARLLDRKTCFERKAAGAEVRSQLIAANVDAAFIVCSLNDDFNLNRIERYLALVNEAGAEPVILLSKADLSDDAAGATRMVQRSNPGVAVEAIDCLSAQSVSALNPWLRAGTTIAVLGSSGVGKSSLINTLLGRSLLKTAAIREDDSKGRHTTTGRSLIRLEQGGLMLDTPGMREIQLTGCEEGVEQTFAEIVELARSCRFADCRHATEPGCAMREAIDRGELAERRLASYLKLRREESFNAASLAERRASDKALGKFYQRTLADSQKLRGR